MKVRVIDGCPVPASIAPYVYIVVRDAGQTASSILRTEAVKSILHRHGKHTQAEIHKMYPGISNPPGFSEHELRSDGNAHDGPRGGRLQEWQVGIDSGGDDQRSKDRVTAAAHGHGWSVLHPYSRGVEGHHWRFAKQPRPKSIRMRAKIIRLRATLPRK